MANDVLWKSLRDHSFRPSPQIKDNCCLSAMLFSPQMLSPAALPSHLPAPEWYPWSNSPVATPPSLLPSAPPEITHPFDTNPSYSQVLHNVLTGTLLRYSPGSFYLFQPNHKWSRPATSPQVHPDSCPKRDLHTSTVSAWICLLLVECINLPPC